MKILTQEQQKLIIAFIDGDINADELAGALDATSLDIPSLLIALLKSAVASGKAAEAEAALGIANSFKNNKSFSNRAFPLLLTLLTMGSHFHHETIINILQHIKDSRSVAILYDTALGVHDYLEYDDFYRIARKCTWALADIGNEEAYHKLRLLAANPSVKAARYAQKRIDSWEKEQTRKAFHFLP